MEDQSSEHSARGITPSIERSTVRRDVLRGATGLVAATLGGAALIGQSAAHFPSELEIDVRGAINPDSHGLVAVFVHRTGTFDPTSEDVRYRFGASDVLADGDGARPHHHVELGRSSLLLFFRANETGFDGDETTGELRWDRDETREHGLSGTDSVRLVG